MTVVGILIVLAFVGAFFYFIISTHAEDKKADKKEASANDDVVSETSAEAHPLEEGDTSAAQGTQSHSTLPSEKTGGIMNMVKSPITSERLEEIGQGFYLAGKRCMLVGACGLILLLLSILITMVIDPTWVGLLLSFNIDSRYAIMYVILPLSYGGIAFGIVGVHFYYIGLLIFALGRIARNTEKQ